MSVRPKFLIVENQYSRFCNYTLRSCIGIICNTRNELAVWVSKNMLNLCSERDMFRCFKKASVRAIIRALDGWLSGLKHRS